MNPLSAFFLPATYTISLLAASSPPSPFLSPHQSVSAAVRPRGASPELKKKYVYAHTSCLAFFKFPPTPTPPASLLSAQAAHHTGRCERANFRPVEARRHYAHSPVSATFSLFCSSVLSLFSSLYLSFGPPLCSLFLFFHPPALGSFLRSCWFGLIAQQPPLSQLTDTVVH